MCILPCSVTIISNVGEMEGVHQVGRKGHMSMSQPQGSGQVIQCRGQEGKKKVLCSCNKRQGLCLWQRNPSS